MCGRRWTLGHSSHISGNRLPCLVRPACLPAPSWLQQWRRILSSFSIQHCVARGLEFHCSPCLAVLRGTFFGVLPSGCVEPTSYVVPRCVHSSKIYVGCFHENIPPHKNKTSRTLMVSIPVVLYSTHHNWLPQVASAPGSIFLLEKLLILP